MQQLRLSRPDDASHVIGIWRAAVDATHDFLSPRDRVALDELVCGFLPQVPLWLAVDSADRPLGFMFVQDGHMEALFVAPDHHGKGIGSMLLQHGLLQHPEMTTDVNEQNQQAAAFYERKGFVRIGRSDLDGQGRPYPLLHLSHRPNLAG